jgi:hypothetical protein
VLVKPTVASAKLDHHGCQPSPPPGTPSVKLAKTGRVVHRFKKQVTIRGKITIRNDSPIQVIVETIQDTVQYKKNGKWKDAPTALESLSSCGPGSCLNVNKKCETDYSVTAEVPLSAQKFRNRVDVKLMFRDKIFSDTTDVEHAFEEPPEEPPPSEPPPSEPPPSP